MSAGSGRVHRPATASSKAPSQRSVSVAAELARAAGDAASTDLRFAGQLLATAVGDLVRILDANFLRRGGSVPELVAAYAAGHGYGPGAPD